MAPLSDHPNAPFPYGVHFGCTFKDNFTPIQKAIMDRKVDIIRELAPFSKNPNVPNHTSWNGWTPIQKTTDLFCKNTDPFTMIQYGEIIEILAPLCDNANEAIHGVTPIQMAVGATNIMVTKILTKYIDNPNAAKTDGGWTPIQLTAEMHYRLSRNHFEIIKLLADLSDNPNAPAPNGWTPIKDRTTGR